jgi:hypothetical protein
VKTNQKTWHHKVSGLKQIAKAAKVTPKLQPMPLAPYPTSKPPTATGTVGPKPALSPAMKDAFEQAMKDREAAGLKQLEADKAKQSGDDTAEPPKDDKAISA